MLRHRRTAILALVAAWILAACTGAEPPPAQPSGTEAGSSASPTPSNPQSASPTPSSVPEVQPEPPPDLARMDDAGAAAAATYFVSLYTYTLQSGDVAAWERLSHGDCGFCAGIRTDALEAAAKGEKYEGGEITLSNVTVLARDDLVGGYPVDAHYSQAPERKLAPTGEVLSTTEANSGAVRIDTFPSQDGWKILAVVIEDA